ncbi:MAG TPA: class I SAM-dependent methyltransferase [bacterium]|jgi:ubiquinone/menaquinone biosynthesis C-methylase UbiE|nr:class I SAM-dependent methyltransferase [bacterium]
MKGVRRDPEHIEVRTLLRRLPLAGSRVLEIGCGDGRLTRRIASVARAVEALDPDTEGIARARRLLPARLARKVRFRVGSGERLPFGGGSFPVAITSWSL